MAQNRIVGSVKNFEDPKAREHATHLGNEMDISKRTSKEEEGVTLALDY